MLRNLTARLYADIPADTLYHYTTFKGLLGILASRTLWASDIRYMNDSAEMKHAADLIKQDVARRIAEGHHNPKLLNQFQYWVGHRITHGHMLFSASFRSNGNLLSQWRGYSSHGKGVSVGFDPRRSSPWRSSSPSRSAAASMTRRPSSALIRQVVDAVEAVAEAEGECTDPHRRPPEQSYYDSFEEVESDLLRIAAILKHPSFQEEEEWRIVSPVLSDLAQAPIRFREGTSMIIPYLEFGLAGPRPRWSSSTFFSAPPPTSASP